MSTTDTATKSRNNRTSITDTGTQQGDATTYIWEMYGTWGRVHFSQKKVNARGRLFPLAESQGWNCVQRQLDFFLNVCHTNPNRITRIAGFIKTNR
jgi:hypothetical protein